MNKLEAKGLLAAQLADYRRLSYAQLAALIGETGIHEVTGDSGAQYQLEIEPIWDDKEGGALRVLGMIDDGSFRHSFKPLCDDFLVAPDGTFVGE